MGLYVLVEAGSAVVALTFWQLVSLAPRSPRAALRMRELGEGLVLILLATGSAWALLLLLAIEPRDLLYLSAGLLWVAALPAVILSARAPRDRPRPGGNPLSGALAAAGAPDLRLAAGAATTLGLLLELFGSLLEGGGGGRSRPLGFRSGGKQAWVDGRYKIQRNGKNKPVRLFDLHLDPGETGDLDEVDLERASDMQAALDLWCSSCDASAAGGDYR